MKYLNKNSLNLSRTLLISIPFFSTSLYIFTAQSQSNTYIPPNTANIHPVALSADPLYAQGAGQKPTLTLALSVEFPTVGAQYRDTYSNSKKYLGYFDASSCYHYSNNESEDNRWFNRIGATGSNYSCGGNGFSGNFMNWATSSSIDLLRYGLTGGDRIQDTGASTVLQRAVLQNDFWNNGSYFPKKEISAALAAQALPSTLRGNHSGTIYISNCSNRVFFSNNSDTGSCASPKFNSSLGAKAPGANGSTAASNSTALSTGMFFTRVKVCDSSGGSLTDPRTTLCQKYPNGNFKPIGNMQKYSDRIRLAAFGYLMENGTNRYGGVLRAPMTYVGPRAYDNNGNALLGNNSLQEWDNNTGVFKTNPRNDSSFGRSGVINYLNTFGRMPGYEGIYKSNDPVGELYYESLRYLQGLQPTTQAISNLDSAKKAGFPAYETWLDPFEGGSNTQNYACLRNSILLIGDVNTHADKSLPGNDRTTNNDFSRTSEVNIASNIPNFKEWTKVVGGFESNNSVAYIDGNGDSKNTKTTPAPSDNSARWGMEAQNTGSGGSAAYYMAGAAYWAHTHDIRGSQWTEATKRRPGMRITTYVLDVNENGSQSTFSNRKQSQFYLTAKYGGFTDIDGDGNPFTPSSTDDTKGTRHWAKDTSPANELDPKTYFLASDADAVLKALDEIFIAATRVSSSIAKPALSSSKLTTTDSYVYQAEFDPEYWSGDVKRRSLKLNESGGIEMSPEAQSVSAASRLDAISTSNLANRKIFIGKTSNITTSYANEFKWADIETSLKNSLNRANASSEPDNLGQSRLDFIRGDRSLEASTFRKRSSRLGDIVNSGVAFSGTPTTRFTDAAYRSFYNDNKNRSHAIFVGANDGMLHAFNASTMDEIFAYIPSWLGGKLSTLTVSDYNSSRHTSYVDATPVIAEAQVNNSWKTVLVSGTGGGGQGVFALDITSPNNFDSSKVLWEFTDADDASLGNVVGQPRILKLQTNPTSNNQTPIYKWFAVIPSGVNNYIEDGSNRFSTTGEPALLFLDLSKRTSESWVLGENYFKITFPLQTSNTSGVLDGNGTSKSSGVINFEATGSPDGSVEFIYIGDLHGQMWKLDMKKVNFTSRNSSEWDLIKASYFKYSTTPKPLYIAQDSNSKVQPISMIPTIAYGPFGSYIISFGTGKYLEASDNSINSSTQIQSFYVLYDLPDDTIERNWSSKFFNGKEHLRSATTSGNTISSEKFTWVSTKDTNDKNKSGWYINFPNGGSSGGEQQVTNAVLFGKDIIFNSILPPTASGSACGGGSSRTYSANLASGIGSVSNLSAGALGAPMLLQLTTKYGASGSTGDRYKTSTVGLLNPSASGLGESGTSIQTRSANFLVGRLSWRQINNYNELKNKSWSE